MTKPEYEIKLREDVCSDEEWRIGPTTDWCDNRNLLSHPKQWVEVRPRELRDPKGRWLLQEGNEAAILVTTVERIKDRTDLDKWLFSSTCTAISGWQACNELIWSELFEDQPIIIKRKVQ